MRELEHSLVDLKVENDFLEVKLLEKPKGLDRRFDESHMRTSVLAAIRVKGLQGDVVTVDCNVVDVGLSLAFVCPRSGGTALRYRSGPPAG